MKKIFWTYIIVGLLSFLGFSSSAASLSLDFVPSSQNVVLGGGLATVDLEVSGLTGNSPYIGGFDVFVDFDPTILGFVSFSYGQYLGDPTIPTAITSLSLINPGEFNVSEVSLLSDLSGLQGGLTQFSLGTIAFGTLGTGTSDLNIALATVAGLVDESGNTLYPSLVSGSITVTSGGPGPGPAAVPEPGTILLFGVGLANVIAVGRNRLKKN